MKITVIEVNNNIIGIKERLNDIEEQIKRLNTDFVILPELSTCGYIPNKDVWKYAEDNGNITKKWAIEMAKKYHIYIGAGFVELKDNDIYNSYLIANKDGILGVVRKNEPESNIFKRGKFNHIIKTPLGNIAISICFDSHKKDFYDAIKNEKISMIIMPHAWPTNKKNEKKDIKKIINLVKSYYESFNCQVIFANAYGNFSKMKGITGLLMNPRKYKLNGNSIIYNGKINFKNLTMDCEITPKKRIKDITFYDNWIDKGSFIFRKIILPLDIKRGIKLYNKSKKNNFK